jgi:serine O-acetyltransferase
MAGKSKTRYLYMWLSRQFVAVGLYRVERGMFLWFGRGWQIVRIILLPIINLLYAYGNSELHYQANIGPGLLLLHTSLGNVVSAKSIIGSDLTLTGGNVIGNRGIKGGASIIVGDNCSMGAHSVIMGPVTLGDNITIGACACVVKDATDHSVLVGVPAKNIHESLKDLTT